MMIIFMWILGWNSWIVVPLAHLDDDDSSFFFLLTFSIWGAISVYGSYLFLKKKKDIRLRRALVFRVI